MLNDDEISELQLAVEQRDLARTESLLQEENGDDLTGLQIFADHTLLMYACERGTPEIVKHLLDKGAQVSELEWSTNNELKSALRNSHQSQEILKLILAAVSFTGVFWLTRDWRLPKGLWRTDKSQQKQNEGEKKQWFPY